MNNSFIPIAATSLSGVFRNRVWSADGILIVDGMGGGRAVWGDAAAF